MGNRDWIFSTEVSRKNGNFYHSLVSLTDIKIKKYPQLKAAYNPFDPAWDDYTEQRAVTKMKFSLKGRKSLIYIWEKQERKCPLCGQPITKQTPWRTMFTEDNKTRLLVHDKCYRSYVYKKRSK